MSSYVVIIMPHGISLLEIYTDDQIGIANVVTICMYTHFAEVLTIEMT